MNITNERNGNGVKDQGDCYRQGGKLIQWCDEATTDNRIAEFDTIYQNIKEAGFETKIAYISDGRRLFVEASIVQ